MSVAIPVNCKGQLLDASGNIPVKRWANGLYISAPSPNAETVFPNGVQSRAGTKRDRYSRYLMPGGGAIGADGEYIPYTPYSTIMQALLKQPGKTTAQRDADVVSYRVYLGLYSGSPADLVEAQEWVDLANTVPEMGQNFTTNHVAADANLVATSPMLSQSMHNV